MKKIIPAIIAALLLFLVYSMLDNDNSDALYTQLIEQERQKRDEFMTTSSDSPFRKYGDSTVRLNYFPINPNYKVTARVELIESRQYLTLGTSTGIPANYQKYAYLKFALNDKKLALLVLKETGKPNGALFTAFADDTSTEETYGGGRYLDLDFKRANRITLDFNLAYNPYCNYNENYSCPFPPADNVLPIRIEAGEKIYKKD